MPQAGVLLRSVQFFLIGSRARPRFGERPVPIDPIAARHEHRIRDSRRRMLWNIFFEKE